METTLRSSFTELGCPILPSLRDIHYDGVNALAQTNYHSNFESAMLKRRDREIGNSTPTDKIPVPKKFRGDFEAMGGMLSLPLPANVNRGRESFDSIAKLKVHNLLSSDDVESPSVSSFYIESPSSSPLLIPNPPSPTDEDNTKTDDGLPSVFKFDKNNPNHIEVENLNQSCAQIMNPQYEGLKIQEVAHLPAGGPRLTKVQQLQLNCENLQFLELFSCKQLISFSDSLRLPNLKHIRLLMLNRLSNQGLLQLLTNAEKLESAFFMDLQSATTITIPSSCSQFKVLDIFECKTLETLNIATNSIQALTLSDGRTLSNLNLRDEIRGLASLKSLKISGCPKLPLSFLDNIRINQLVKLELISNAPSAKAYMKIDESKFDTFVKNNCRHLQDITLDKIHNISLNTVLTLIDQCKCTLVNVTLDLTSIEKPKVREALRHCDNLKDWKVEKWYIKKKWTEW